MTCISLVSGIGVLMLAIGSQQDILAFIVSLIDIHGSDVISCIVGIVDVKNRQKSCNYLWGILVIFNSYPISVGVSRAVVPSSTCA